MRFTNKYNFPSVIVNAVTTVNAKYSPGDADISTTQLIDAPLQKVLKERHADEIVVDISDMIWSFFGSIGHEILNNIDTDEVIFKEERFYINVQDWIISGQPDLYYKNGNNAKVLSDFKVSAKYAFKDGVKPEYVKQLNVYKYMLEQHSYPVDRLENIVIFRDALAHEEKVQVFEVTRYKEAKIREYIEKRVRMHQIASEQLEEEVVVCTPFERWQDPSVYCVMKKGNVKQTGGSYALMSEAEAFMGSLKDKHPKNEYSVKEKPSIAKRCERYCTVSNFCLWWKKEKDK